MSEETTQQAETAANTTTAEKKQVPQFLKVLFILSYIGIALAIIGNLAMIKSMIGIIGIVSAIGCLIGVLQMRKLKRIGFYIYTVFEILPTIYGLITMGGAMFSLGSLGGGFMAMYAFLSALFPIIFIILYAVNLKHLK